MAAMSREITTIDVIEETKRHLFVGSMGSMAIHNNQTGI
jgi:hypothetical protein